MKRTLIIQVRFLAASPKILHTSEVLGKEKKYVYNIIHLYNILRMIFIYHHNWYHCFSCLWPLTMQPWCACEATCQQLQSCQQRQGLNTMGPWDFDKSQGEHCCEIATRWFKKSGMGCCLGRLKWTDCDLDHCHDVTSIWWLHTPSSGSDVEQRRDAWLVKFFHLRL